MRDKDRIKPFLKKLEEYWLLNPDLRFGQMVYNLGYMIGNDIYFPEEKEWLNVIQKEIDISK